jgi:hypothetical protein
MHLVGWYDQRRREEEQRQKETIEIQEEHFPAILRTRDPFLRAEIWRKLINCTNAMGEGVLKAVAKLYLNGFRTARLGRNADLEYDESFEELYWNGIRIDIGQLKEWLTRHIISEPLEHRIDMVLKCQKFLNFTSEQMTRIQYSIFFDPQNDIRRFTKLFRKAIERRICGWNSMAMIIRAVVEKWGVQPVKCTTKEFFNQEEYRTLWCQMHTEDLEQQLRNRLEARELGLFLPHSDERLYFKWLRQLSDPAEHARAMILLQRTQELKKAD